MRHARYAALATFLASCLFADPTLAQTEQADQAMRLILQRSLLLQPGQKVDDARNAMLRLFEVSDIDGDGISKTDFALRKSIDGARIRASFMRNWLFADLDGDGQVTKDELEIVFGQELREALSKDKIGPASIDPELPRFVDQRIQGLLDADADHDRVVTFAEALAHASARLGRSPGPDIDPAIPLVLDADGDGRVTETEFRQSLERVLANADTDGDGTFSDQEIASQRAAIETAAKNAGSDRQRTLSLADQNLIAKCGFPAVPPGAQTALIIVDHGRALAAATLGEGDEPLSVADVEIEAGPAPLYVLLASNRPMIWRFSGQVRRVATVVANSQARSAAGFARVGLIGLPKKALYIPPDPTCLPYLGLSDPGKVRETVSWLSSILGQRMSRYVVTSSVSDVHLPSGMTNQIADYPDAVRPLLGRSSDVMWRMALRAYPGGLVFIAPAEVVSPLPVVALGTLPAEAGIAQLLDAGALRVTETNRITMLGGSIIFSGPNATIVVAPGSKVQRLDLPAEITILQKIRMPARVDGGLYQFRLAPGVPEPDGMTDRVKLVR